MIIFIKGMQIFQGDPYYILHDSNGLLTITLGCKLFYVGMFTIPPLLKNCYTSADIST